MRIFGFIALILGGAYWLLLFYRAFTQKALSYVLAVMPGIIGIVLFVLVKMDCPTSGGGFCGTFRIIFVSGVVYIYAATAICEVITTRIKKSTKQEKAK